MNAQYAQTPQDWMSLLPATVTPPGGYAGNAPMQPLPNTYRGPFGSGPHTGTMNGRPLQIDPSDNATWQQNVLNFPMWGGGRSQFMLDNYGGSWASLLPNYPMPEANAQPFQSNGQFGLLAQQLAQQAGQQQPSSPGLLGPGQRPTRIPTRMVK